ncbi:hypothetical protein GP486_001670 [Trichoglossum hirsutum]|uniref:Checkpoint protein RAD24-like helical bundle domain-containing protein n=1 Tax=Trichoglossum hirsutum TaxID=265104 RepID=A0A9P8RSU2_9PEZI|nr:hypothetical protein GP486_001670 [Trichoglossum hirsutum]
MVPPTTKRPKRRIVGSSDDEWNGGSPPKKKKLSTKKPENTSGTINGVGSLPNLALPTRTPPKRKSPRKPASSRTTPNSSPEKPKGKTKNGGKPPNSRSIYSFFTSSTQQQRSTQGIECQVPEEERDDTIQDDSHDDDIIPNRDASGACRAGNTVNDGVVSRSITGASQRFLKTENAARSSVSPEASATSNEDLRPWAEKYAPTSLDELAVHKKKVSDVRAWLESVFGGRDRKRLLILKGPSGTGKTTTVSLLSKDMGFDILEWRNPVGTEYSSEGIVSVSAQFEEFLGRGGKFGSLDLSNSMEEPRDGAAEAANAPSRKKIILVEEFPNTFTRSSTALQSFRSSLQYFLASSCPTPGTIFSNQTPASEQIIPLVLIISETLLTTTTASADSFTVHRLVGQEILNHLGVSLINFNPIAPTLLAKAMDLVIQKEARKTGRRKTLGRLARDRLGEVGDIRSAVGSLEFLCLRRDDNGDWGGRVTFGKGKKISKDTPLTEMERESLELVTQREASLGIFHAVGKIVYNKRVDGDPLDLGSCPISQPPDHLPQHVRLKRSQVSVDELIDETGTDIQTFISALHENYVLSCGYLSSEASLLDSVNGCIDSLSDSDILCPNWNGGLSSGGGFGRGTFQGAGADSLRQDEMSFQIAVRGILFSLPYPVRRKPPSSPGNTASWNRVGGRGDPHKMFYPTALKLWRQAEEIKGAVDAWISRFMRGEVTVSRKAFPQPGPEAKSGNVQSWRSNFKEHSGTHTTGGGSSSDASAATPPLNGGSAAHREMTLERLPYMAKIEWRNVATLREIEKVTLFRGTVAQSDEIPDDDEEEMPIVQWATDRPNELGSTPRKRNPRSREFEVDGTRRGGLGFQMSVEKVEGLTLSDDDIEDD